MGCGERKRRKTRVNDGYSIQKRERKTAFEVVLVIIISLVSLYYISGKYSDYKTRAILEDPAFAIGTITHVSNNLYVGADFKAAGKPYSFQRRVPREMLQDYIVGDTVVVIYSRTDPNNVAFRKGFARLLRK